MTSHFGNGPGGRPAGHLPAWVGVLVLLAFCGVIWWVAMPLSSHATTQGNGDKTGARVACEQLTAQRMPAPSQTSFGVIGGTEDAVQDLGGGHYRVAGYVDATNAFGAKLRHLYACDVQSTPTEYKLLALTVR